MLNPNAISSEYYYLPGWFAYFVAMLPFWRYVIYDFVFCKNIDFRFFGLMLPYLVCLIVFASDGVFYYVAFLAILITILVIVVFFVFYLYKKRKFSFIENKENIENRKRKRFSRKERKIAREKSK